MIRTTTCPWAGTFTIPDDLIFCDLTLREGEQSPGVTYTEEEKLELVRKLDDYGVQQIQLTTPGLNPRILSLCRKITSLGLRAKTEIMTGGMAANWKECVDAAASCNPSIIHSGFEVSEYNRKEWNESVKSAMLERIAQVTAYIRRTGKLVNISFNDATRAEFTFLMQCIETAAQAGADRIRICDSFGVGTPEAYTVAVENAVRIAQPYGAIIGVHCHNDFGFALANTIASIRAGAKMADLCCNGLGDRAGNADLVETVLVLETIYKKSTGFRVEKSLELARYVERISGIALPAGKPFVGANVYAEEASDHAVEQFTRPVYGRSIVPEDIGARLGVIYGKLTDERVIRLSAQAANRDIPEQCYGRIMQALYDEAEQRKGKPLYETDFWTIVDKIMAQK